MRDYFKRFEENDGIRLPREVKMSKIRGSYERLFSGLRDQIEGFIANCGGFQKLGEKNYNPTHDGLYDNVYNTEIDIVMESRRYLFIGEAKHKIGFHANGNVVLVHQLIRQYAMARILIDFTESDKTIIPFIVGGNKKQHQVVFMIKHGWMKEKNILSWQDIEAIST